MEWGCGLIVVPSFHVLVAVLLSLNVIARRCRMWLSCTINNNKRRPMSSFVVWLPRHPVATRHQVLA